MDAEGLGLAGLRLAGPSNAPSTADGPSLELLDLPDALVSSILSQLPLHSLFAASTSCTRLYDAALPLWAGQLQKLTAATAAGTGGSGGVAVHGLANPPPNPAGSSSRDAQRQQRAACALRLRSACTHCGGLPKGYQVKEHPVNPRFRLCRRCAKLDDYKMITLDNAIEQYGLLKTDLRRLPQFRETKKVPGKGAAPRWRTYTWHCLQDVEGRAEVLFGEGWRDRADFLAHEA